MKVKMMIIAFAVAFAMATQVSAECGPCNAVNPCNACDACCAKPCDLFSGLKNLLQCRPSIVACSPCEPVVACGPSVCDPCEPCVANACDPCTACDPCGDVNACAPCGTGFKLGGFGLFNHCNLCGPSACGSCDPCTTNDCDPCGPTACGSCGCGDCGCPGPVASFLIKSRSGAKKLFKNLFGSLDCGYDCGACGPTICGACDPCGNECGPQACGAVPPACGCCQ